MVVLKNVLFTIVKDKRKGGATINQAFFKKGLTTMKKNAKEQPMKPENAHMADNSTGRSLEDFLASIENPFTQRSHEDIDFFDAWRSLYPDEINNHRFNEGREAFVYCRCASPIGADASIEHQLKVVRDYAAYSSLLITNIYTDRGSSGATVDRPELKKMFYDMKNEHPAFLIVANPDRLSRECNKLIGLEAAMKNMGVRIVYPTLEHYDNEIMRSMLYCMTEFYAKVQRENVRRGKLKSAEKALYLGTNVVGYKGEKGKTYEIDHSTAPQIEKAFDDFVAGASLKSISDDLNNNGLRTSRGTEFNSRSLRRLLRNRSYIGEYRFGEMVIPDGMPAIVSTSTFEAAQDRLDNMMTINGNHNNMEANCYGTEN